MADDPDIEITPEMMTKGVEIIENLSGCADLFEMAQQVYIEMERVRRRRQPERPVFVGHPKEAKKLSTI